jgi:3-oxoacyl-[acyl-carrier-protein] synthase-3
MGVIISKISIYLPSQILSNDDLLLEAEETTLTSLKIYSKLGIKQRHIAADGETSLDLAYNACVNVLENFKKENIDFLLFCTQSPDYILPTSACLLQDKLGLNTKTGAIDFNLGCSGYIYGLALAKGLIEAGVASNILLVTAETYSKMLNPKDVSNRSIFGDGAAATILSRSNDNRIFHMELGTDGSGFSNLIVENGGFRNPLNKLVLQNSSKNNYLDMNGPEIFNFTLDSVPKLVESVLKKNNMNLTDVDFFIFHQANKFMLDYLRTKIGIAREKFYINLERTGNTVSATIPIGLQDAQEKGLIKKGDIVMLCGFGVGYSWGATIIKI